MATLTTDPSPRLTEPVAPRRLLLVAALGIVYVAWGSTYLAVRVMVDEMPALMGSGTRALAAGALLAVGLAVWGGVEQLRLTRPQLVGCALVGLLLPVGGQGLVAVAEDRGAPSGLTAVLVAAVPLWVGCLRGLVGDRPPRRSVAGMVVGFAGVVILVVGGGGAGTGPTWALLIVVLASMSWALGTWLQPRLTLPANAFALVVYEMLIGGTVLTVLGAARGEHFDPAAYTGEGVGGVGLPAAGRVHPGADRLQLAASVHQRLGGRDLRLREPGDCRASRLARPQRGRHHDHDAGRRRGRGRRRPRGHR